MIPEHIQEKVSQLWNAPSIDDWLTERLTAKEKEMYVQLMAARYSTTEKFPVDFNDLWKVAGYSSKHKGLECLLKNYTERSHYILLTHTGDNSGRGRPADSYVLTIDCAQQFALEAKTEAGREVRSFFVRVLAVVQEYHLLTVLLAERQRGMEEKHKLLIQQNPSGTGVIYILDMGVIDGVHYLKVGATDDVGKRFQGLRNTLEIPPNRCLFVDMIASPNNWAVEKAFHKHPDAKEHRVTLNIKGHNQTEIYKKSKKFNAVLAGNLLRALSKDALANEDAKRIHEEKMLTLSIEQGKSRQEVMRELIAAGLTGTDLLQALTTMFPTEPNISSPARDDAEIAHGLEYIGTGVCDDAVSKVAEFIQERMTTRTDGEVAWKNLSNAFREMFPRDKTPVADLRKEFLKLGVRYEDTTDTIDGKRVHFRGARGWELN